MKRSQTILVLTLLLALVLSACQPGAKPVTIHPTSLPTAALSTTAPTTVPTNPQLTATEPPVETAQPITVTETLAPPLAWSGPLPILTGDNQGLTFGPGQIVAAFGEGFQPGETVAVSLLHDERGVLLNITAKVDSLGYVLTVKRLKQAANEKDTLPAGHLVYQLAGAAQTKKFSFFVDYALPPGTTPKGCGFYPEKAVFNGYQVFFCGGLSPDQAYQLTSRLGDASDQAVNTADPFGLALFPLRQSSDTLSPGVWTVTLGVAPASDVAATDLGFPPMTVEILPEP